MLRLIEPLDIIHMRRAQQFPIQSVGPGVVWTLDSLRELSSLRFAHPRPAMTADIVQRMQLALLVAHNDQTLACNFSQQIAAGVFQLALMPDANPLVQKDASPF